MADYYFNFPPITSLTLPQQSALNEPNAIALSGGPGTGKSFVSLWRHISNHKRENPIKSQLLTFTTSLAYYLKASSNSEDKTAGSYVDSTQNWYHNSPAQRTEIIVDEAQDMPLEFYANEDRLQQYSDKISYGADDKQILKSSSLKQDGLFNLDVCSPEAELNNLFGNKRYVLDRNFRNTKSILQFANHTFTDAFIPVNEINSCTEIGDKPSLLVSNGSLDLQNDNIKSIIRQLNADEYNIAILTPLNSTTGTGWQKLTAKYYYDLLKDEFDVSYYGHTEHAGVGLTKMKNIHITPFKSAKGLEFDTVIIPCFNYYTFKFNVLSWRDFFVGVTRAKSSLFLFSENDIPALSNVVDMQVLSRQDNTPTSNLETDDLPF